MAKKRKPILLDKLARESLPKLRSMVTELAGLASHGTNDTGKPSPWKRRFAASGKFKMS